MASTPPDWFFKTLSRSHTFLYRRTGGRVGKKFSGMSVLLLTTTGRKSGKQRTTTLSYLRDGDDYLIAGSKGGSESNPAWYLNLDATREVRVQVGSEVFAANASVTEGDDRDRLYERFKALDDEYVKYESQTERTIPVVRLTPA